MPAYRITPNEHCVVSERKEALQLALSQALSRASDIQWFRREENALFLQTRITDLRTIRPEYCFPFSETFPWLTIEDIPEERVSISLPKAKISQFVSRHSSFTYHWDTGQQFKENGQLDNRSLCDDAFLFPASIACRYGDHDVFVAILPCKRVRFPEASAMKPYCLPFIHKNGTWVRCEELIDPLFAYRDSANASPFARMFDKTIRIHPELPDIFSAFDMQSSMMVWLRAAQKHARVPETAIFPIPSNFETLLDNQTPLCFHSYCQSLRTYAESRTLPLFLPYAESRTLPLFLRTDLTSGKHSFARTCQLSDLDKIGNHLAEIVNFSAIADLPYSCFVLREWISGPSAWIEEDFGNMPVRREFRFFVENGEVSHIQPYWPEEAFEHCDTKPSDWQRRLTELTHLSQDDLRYLADRSRRIAGELQDDWSIDWLWSEDGWWLTDMALASQSYRYTPPAEWVANYAFHH